MESIEIIDHPDKNHFVLRGRLVGENEAWADCQCGWGVVGTTEEVNAAIKAHQADTGS